jgi:hypothetical protein
MRRIEALALALALAGSVAQAQLATPDPDWKEVEVPLPGPLRTAPLIKLEVPQSTLRFGVDPASVALGSDGIVRYVVVATSSTGAVNAFYEGIRCNSGEFRVYARHNPDSGWVPVKDGPWRSLHDRLPSHHSLVIARTGACMGHGPNRSAAQIVRDLGANVDRRFNNY